MPFDQNLIQTRDVADRLKVTPSAVSRMVKRGALSPAHKLAGRRGAFMFDRADIEALAQERAR